MPWGSDPVRSPSLREVKESFVSKALYLSTWENAMKSIAQPVCLLIVTLLSGCNSSDQPMDYRPFASQMAALEFILFDLDDELVLPQISTNRTLWSTYAATFLQRRWQLRLLPRLPSVNQEERGCVSSRLFPFSN